MLHFWKRRWFRTIPNYLLFLGIFTAICFLAPARVLGESSWHEAFTLRHVKDLAYYPFFIQNFLSTDISFMGHTWSLAVEEWFYLLLPCMVVPAIYLNRKGSLKNKMLLCFAGLSIMLIMIRVAGAMHIWPGYTKLAVIYNLDNLLFGVIMGWLFTYYRSEVLQRKTLLLATGVVLFLAGFVLQNAFILTGKPQEAWDALIVPVQTIAFACALPWFYDIKINKTTWMSRLVTRISEVSYSIYLVHFIILVFVIDTVRFRFGVESAAGSFAMFLLFLAVTVWVSSLNYRFFEKPMTLLRERVSLG
jgi:peptidoglycan/LPS O-acetylase OafA/YrhL